MMVAGQKVDQEDSLAGSVMMVAAGHTRHRNKLLLLSQYPQQGHRLAAVSFRDA